MQCLHALGTYVNAVQWDVYSFCAAVIGMVFEAKNELQQYLSSINPIYLCEIHRGIVGK